MFGNGENESKNPAWSNNNWLKSRFHFSFAEHRDGRQQFGVLRVMNDDLVQPHRGFGTHGHANMEIATYIVDGHLTHQDSMGTSESLGRGAVQFMTAGHGVRHSEFNHSDSPLRFIQMWILPSKRNLQPNYGSFVGDYEARHNKLAHLVSDVRSTDGGNTAVQINQDANIYAAELDAGKSVSYELQQNRMLYLLCIENAVSVSAKDATGDLAMNQQDAADIFGPASLTFQAGPSGAHILFVEMAEV